MIYMIYWFFFGVYRENYIPAKDLRSWFNLIDAINMALNYYRSIPAGYFCAGALVQCFGTFVYVVGFLEGPILTCGFHRMTVVRLIEIYRSPTPHIRFIGTYSHSIRSNIRSQCIKLRVWSRERKPTCNFSFAFLLVKNINRSKMKNFQKNSRMGYAIYTITNSNPANFRLMLHFRNKPG